MDFLKGCGEPKTRKQIAEAINEDPVRVSKILRTLLKWGEIKCVEYSGEEASKLVEYILVRRTRFYFLDD